jgi:SAM-dependent MidA family methyltransferase
MELALYCPNSGYYRRAADQVGRYGDFFTSVSTGSLFGEMLAFQFAHWLEGIAANPVHLVEAGAHDGQLAFDILDWLRHHRPAVFNRLGYWVIEPSQRQQTWQRAKLEQFAGRVHWTQSLQALPGSGVNGVIFSNELLDAFPAHRLVWEQASKRWVESGVTLSNGQFVWSPLPDVECDWNTELTQAGFELSPELKAVLPDGFIIEHCPEARTWWRQAAVALHRGWLLTIDYGLDAQQFLSPERSQGTLRAYRRHQPISNILANPGEQDLTAHVNFTQLQKAGEDEGLKTDGFLTQAQFLTDIARNMWSEGSSAPSSIQARQFQTLTHPEHLGRSFRVLIQSRNR